MFVFVLLWGFFFSFLVVWLCVSFLGVWEGRGGGGGGGGGRSLVDRRVFTLVGELDLEILNIRLGICKLPSFEDRLPNTLPEPCFCKTARGGVGGWGEGAAGGTEVYVPVAPEGLSKRPHHLSPHNDLHTTA